MQWRFHYSNSVCPICRGERIGFTFLYQSSAKSLGIDAGDGQRDDVNTHAVRTFQKLNLQKLTIEARVELS
jgi:hypothetical protein